MKAIAISRDELAAKIRGLRSQNSKLNLFSYHCPDSWTHWYF